MAIPAKPTLTTPPTAPVRGEDRTAFAAKANARVAWQGTNTAEMTAAIDWQNTVFTATETEATDAEASAVVANTKSDIAVAAADAAVVTANASAWVSGASYDINDNAISQIDFKTYRAKSTFTGQTIDPSLDPTNWVPLNPVAASPGLVILSSASASSDVSVSFTGIDDSYDEYELHILSAIPATDGAFSYIRTSSDGGSSYDSGSSDYYQIASRLQTSSFSALAATNSAQIRFAVSVGGAAGEGSSAIIRIIRPSETTTTKIDVEGTYINLNGLLVRETNYAVRSETAIVNAIQFIFSAGNVSSGLFALYGVKR